MFYKLTLYTEYHVGENGKEYDAKEWHYDCPFKYDQTVYYVYPQFRLFRKSRWVVRKSEIRGVWATNTYGVTLDNNYHIEQGEFDMLFEDRDDAIEFCLKKNQQSKVKVYNE